MVLRTDEIRKRLLNIPPTQPLSRDHYTPRSQGEVYDAMIENARAMLAAGRSVVLDASFMDAGLRARVAQLAVDAGVPFDGLWLEAPAAVLEARVAARTGDASDANVEVLREQLARFDTASVEWTHVDASGDTAQAAHTWISSDR